MFGGSDGLREHNHNSNCTNDYSDLTGCVRTAGVNLTPLLVQLLHVRLICVAAHQHLLLT